MRIPWKNVLLSLISLTATLAVLETVFRLVEPARELQPRRVFYDGLIHDWCCGPQGFDPDGIYGYFPNTEFRHCYDGDPGGTLDKDHCAVYRINSRGFRDVEREAGKPEDVYRILVYGDSFTAGEGVAFEDLFTSRLEAALSSGQIEGKRVEVWNLGIPGSETGSERRRHARHAAELTADLVVVQWNTNDFPSSALYEDHQKIIGYRYRNLNRDLARFRWSHLVYFAAKQWHLHRISKELITLTRREIEDGRHNFVELKAFYDDVRRENADFLVVVFPEIIRFGNYPYRNLVDAMKKYCAESGIPVLDALPQLSKFKDRDLWVHESDHHPNRLAHRIVGELLAGQLAPDAFSASNTRTRSSSSFTASSRTADSLP